MVLLIAGTQKIKSRGSTFNIVDARVIRTYCTRAQTELALRFALISFPLPLDGYDDYPIARAGYRHFCFLFF